MYLEGHFLILHTNLESDVFWTEMFIINYKNSLKNEQIKKNHYKCSMVLYVIWTDYLLEQFQRIKLT